MNKKTLGLALISSTLSLPALAADVSGANVDFYGSLRVMLERADHNSGVDYKDASSRVGIKGSKDFGDGLSAFAKYEVALDLSDDDDTIGDMRYGHLGLQGDFGTLAVGKVDSPFYEAVGVAADYMWWNSAPVYYTLDGGLRISESLYYRTPDISGFSIQALAQVDSSNNDHEQSQLGATYAMGSVTLGAAYANTSDDSDLFGLSAYYSHEAFYLNGAYMNKEDDGSGIDAILGIPAGKNLYTLGVSDFSDDDGNNDFTAVILAYQHNLRDDLKVWLEAMAWDGSLYGNEDSNTINLGMNFDF